jgi:hypothetical protein
VPLKDDGGTYRVSALPRPLSGIGKSGGAGPDLSETTFYLKGCQRHAKCEGRVAKQILCDVAGTALLSHLPYGQAFVPASSRANS